MKLRCLGAALALTVLAACAPGGQTPTPPASTALPTTTTTTPPVTTSTVAPPTSSTTPPPVTSTSLPPTASTTAAPSPTPTPPVTPPVPVGRTYPVHTGIISTTYWVGEIFDPKLPDGSQVCSAYDSLWAYHWSGGVNKGKAPSGTDCAGSILGGCDGVTANNKCATEVRLASNGFFPTDPKVTPKENPFYLDIPYDDINDPTAFKNRCKDIPWANDSGYAGKCGDTKFSYMKNRWLKITGPNGQTCYGQVEDAGPSSGSAYHDAAYVFGANNARPAHKGFNNAGMDVSPALNGCLGFKELDGENDKVTWQFVDNTDVPVGPWSKVVTTSGVTE